MFQTGLMLAGNFLPTRLQFFYGNMNQIKGSDVDKQPSSNDPEWLRRIEELANAQLGTGSSCEQVHPIVARWFEKLMNSEPPESRDSVVQAISCLATEVLFSSPEHLTDTLLDNVDEDEVAMWIEQILLVGRAFEIALRNGELDDL